MGTAQAEDHVALGPGKPEGMLGQICRKPLAGQGNHREGDGYQQGLGSLEDHRRIHQHAYFDEEERNEQRVADELDAVHQCRGMRHQPVEGQPGQKGANDRFQSGQFGQKGGDEYHCKHKNVLHHPVLLRVPKEPAPDDGEAPQHGGGEQANGQQHPSPEQDIQLSAHRGGDHHQDEQGGRVGDHGAPHGDGDRLVANDAQAAGDGVRNQGMGGEHAGQQHRGAKRILQEVVAHQGAHDERNGKGNGTENEATLPVLAKSRLHLQPRDEHDVSSPTVPNRVVSVWASR